MKLHVLRRFFYILMPFAILHVNAGTVLHDDFDDNALDPAWTVTFPDSNGWTFSESGTQLTVTDIDPAIINPGGGGTWAKVVLSQSFTSLSDFHVDLDFSWDSAGSLRAMQALYFRLFDADDTEIAVVGYGDAWIAQSGERFGRVGANNANSGFNSLPFGDTATVDISRVNDDIDIIWDGGNLVSGTSDAALGRIDMEFWFYAAAVFPPPFFGTESVDLISVSGTEAAVPEPSTYMFILSGCLGLTLMRRRRRRTASQG